MVKMCFPNTVNYNGTVYSSRQPFDVKDADVEELRKKGGWVIQTETKQSKTSKSKVKQ